MRRNKSSCPIMTTMKVATNKPKIASNINMRKCEQVVRDRPEERYILKENQTKQTPSPDYLQQTTNLVKINQNTYKVLCCCFDLLLMRVVISILAGVLPVVCDLLPLVQYQY